MPLEFPNNKFIGKLVVIVLQPIFGTLLFIPFLCPCCVDETYTCKSMKFKILSQWCSPSLLIEQSHYFRSNLSVIDFLSYSSGT